MNKNIKVWILSFTFGVILTSLSYFVVINKDGRIYYCSEADAGPLDELAIVNKSYEWRGLPVPYFNGVSSLSPEGLSLEGCMSAEPTGNPGGFAIGLFVIDTAFWSLFSWLGLVLYYRHKRRA